MEANRPNSALLATMFTSVFLVILVSYLREVESLASSDSPDYCTAVINYIKRHYDRQITLDDLARITGIHPKYLCHKFSTQMGIPPMQALTLERINAAKQLLCNTTMPISEIACREGYSDIAHFSKRFKTIIGVSPTDYRKLESAAFHYADAKMHDTS